jgi:hypothetical protein
VVGTPDGRHAAYWIGALALAAGLTRANGAHARPNTHAPAISTWDARASSVVFGLGQAMTGAGAYRHISYSANFSSTSGVLSAQFGLHYMTLKSTDEGPTAQGVSAGGVALFSFPLSDIFENGVPRTSFAFYVGGVPTALISGELNFISIPLVLGVGLPYSPSPRFTFRPWLELSPGLNFDTSIQPVATDEAIQSAMDGTLTRDEVEALVEQGLDIQRETTLGKRAGLSVSAHLGERVDFDVNMVLGAGRGSALGLGAALVVRWDTMVSELGSERQVDEDCAALAARYHRQCPLRRNAAGARGGQATRPHAPPRSPAPGQPEAVKPAAKKAAPKPAAAPAPTPAAGGPARTNELPPLQAAPPRPL